MRRIILSLLAISLCICPSYAGDVDIKDVKGTSLAGLGDAFEVLRKFSSVTFENGAFNVAGKGKAVIFVDGRRLDSHLDLKTIPAASVEKIEIISEARPEYGNSDGVILVTLNKAQSDEFNLEDLAELTVSPFVGGSNDVELSGRKNKLLYEGGLAVSYTGTNDLESRTTDTYEENPDRQELWIRKRKIQDFNDINRDLSIAAKAYLGWQANPDHLLGIRYEYNYLNSNGNWGSLQDRLFSRKGSAIDLVNPSAVFGATSTSKSGTHNHKLNLSYQGDASGWKLTANIDILGAIKDGRDVDYESPDGVSSCTSDNSSRYVGLDGFLRFNASHRLWKGEVLMGLSLDDYIQNSRSYNTCVKNSLINSDLFNVIPGAFVSLRQDFGVVDFDLGLHYQYYYATYTPREDDCTRDRIRKLIGQETIVHRDWMLHPHLSLSAPIGKGKLSAGVQVITDFPQFSEISIRIDELRKGDPSDAFAFPARRDEFFLKGEWKWLQVNGWATHNVRPLFTDVDGSADFNAPDYWAMDWKLTLSLSVGIWETGLTATLHKQWLGMETLAGEDDLRAPMATVNWVNSFSLPWGMRVDLTAMLRTRGAEGNAFHRSVLFKTDLAVHQPFLNDHLVLSLGADNLFRTRQTTAFNTRASGMEFVWNERLDCRMFRFSVKFTL